MLILKIIFISLFINNIYSVSSTLGDYINSGCNKGDFRGLEYQIQNYTKNNYDFQTIPGPTMEFQFYFDPKIRHKILPKIVLEKLIEVMKERRKKMTILKTVEYVTGQYVDYKCKKTKIEEGYSIFHTGKALQIEDSYIWLSYMEKRSFVYYPAEDAFFYTGEFENEVDYLLEQMKAIGKILSRATGKQYTYSRYRTEQKYFTTNRVQFSIWNTSPSIKFDLSNFQTYGFLYNSYDEMKALKRETYDVESYSAKKYRKYGNIHTHTYTFKNIKPHNQASVSLSGVFLTQDSNNTGVVQIGNHQSELIRTHAYLSEFSGSILAPHTGDDIDIVIKCEVNNCNTKIGFFVTSFCEIGCKECERYNGCKVCDDTLNRELYKLGSRGICNCKEGYEEDADTEQCVQYPKNEKGVGFDGPYMQLFIPELLHNNNLCCYSSLEEAMNVCLNKDKCTGVVYSKFRGDEYSYKPREGKFIRTFLNKEEELENELSISKGWVKLERCYEFCAYCKEWLNPNACTSCIPGKLLQKNTCVDQCSMGYYKKPGYNKCIYCGWSCTTCESKDICLVCRKGFYKQKMENNTYCKYWCKENYFPSWNELGERTCQKCHENCQRCFGPTYRECLSCNKGYYFLDGTMCLDYCPLSYFYSETKNIYNGEMDKLCTKCFHFNPLCNKYGKFSMINSIYHFPYKGKIYKNVITSYRNKLKSLDECKWKIFPVDGNQLLICTHRCPEHTVTNGNECSLKCDDDLFLIESNRHCVQKQNIPEDLLIQEKLAVQYCHIGYTQKKIDNQTQCVKCQTSYCAGCYFNPTTNEETCTNCIVEFYLKNNECQRRCDEGYFYKDGSCIECNPNCKSCENSLNCMTCKEQFKFYSIYKKYQYQDFRSYKGIECHSECPEDMTYNFDQEEQDGKYKCIYKHSQTEKILIPPKEQEQCPKIGFLEKNDICRQCRNLFCQECQENIDSCSKCYNGYYLEEGNCKLCHNSCLNCLGPSEKDCLDCKVFTSEKVKVDGETYQCTDRDSNEGGAVGYGKSIDANVLLQNLLVLQINNRKCTYQDILNANMPYQLEKLKLFKNKCKQYHNFQKLNSFYNMEMGVYAAFLGSLGFKSLENFDPYKVKGTQFHKFEYLTSIYGKTVFEDLDFSVNNLKTVYSNSFFYSGDCDSLTCSYAVDERVIFYYQNEIDSLQKIIIEKDSRNMYFYNSEGDFIMDYQMVQDSLPYHEECVESFLKLVSEYKNIQEYAIQVVLSGNDPKNLKAVGILSSVYQENGQKKVKIIQPGYYKEIDIDLKGGNEGFRIQYVQVLKAKWEQVSFTKLACRIGSSEFDGNSVKFLKQLQIDTVFIDTKYMGYRQTENKIEIARNEGLKAHVVFHPCMDTQNFEEIKYRYIVSEDTIPKMERFWLNLNNEWNCDYDYDTKYKEQKIDLMADLITELQEAGYKIGIYTSGYAWNNYFLNTDKFSTEFSDILLWITEADDEYEVQKGNLFGGWSSVAYKSFKSRHFMAYGEYQLVSKNI